MGRIRLKKVDRKTLLNVLKGIDEAVKELIEGSLNMLIDEQTDVNMVSGKILNKVNLVNDWGTRLKEELGKKTYGGRSSQEHGSCRKCGT